MTSMNRPILTPDVDYYITSDGKQIFTKKYHLDRGYCCQSGCLNCPYAHKDEIDPSIPSEFRDVWSDESCEEDDS